MKTHRNFAVSRAVAALLSILLLFGIFTAAVPASAAENEGEAEAPVVQIDKTYLKAGEPIKVINPHGYSLRFYVNNGERARDSFTPTEADYEKWIKVKAFDGDVDMGQDKAYFSKLPVLYINTDDGEKITSKEEYKSATLKIQNNTETEKMMYDGVVNIKGRGNTSWSLYPKKPYRLKLDKKADLFGLGKNKNWALLSNYLDECYLRNKTAEQISMEFGLETMQSTWTDLIINGEYAGNYQIYEQIRVDETRVNIFDWEEEAKDVASAVAKKEKEKGNSVKKDELSDYLEQNLSWITTGEFEFNGVKYTVADYYEVNKDITGGFLFESSIEYDEVSQFKTASGLPVMVKSPEYLNSNTEMFNYAKTLFQNYENSIRSEDGYTETADGKMHYTDIADMTSMVDYWLVNEIVGNGDAARKSRFMYKDIGGQKLTFGPPWDFDWGCGAQVVGDDATGWKVTEWEQAFFDQLKDDPYFLVIAGEHYHKIRPFLQTLIEDGGIIDQETDYLRESGLVDQELWKRRWWLGDDVARGFEKDAQMYKKYLTERFAWLDEQFETDDKLVKSNYTEKSCYPYTRDEKLAVSFPDAAEDTASKTAPADAMIGAEDDLSVEITVNDENVKSVNVYLNGLSFLTVEPEGGKAAFTIESGSFDEELNRKNVIALIAKDADGNTAMRNFATVLRAGEQSGIIIGDVNGDGVVTIDDATAIQKHLAQMITLEGDSLKAADTNGDGSVTIDDATQIQKFLAQMIEKL